MSRIASRSENITAWLINDHELLTVDLVLGPYITPITSLRIGNKKAFSRKERLHKAAGMGHKGGRLRPKGRYPHLCTTPMAA
jgi:hypothetical protein